MGEQILRDSHGTKLGSIKEENGKLVIRDAHGTAKGSYDPKTNTTRDVHGSSIGTGNLLATLL